jgi:hypothetical protein
MNKEFDWNQMVTACGNFWRGPLIRLFKSIVLLHAYHASHFKTPTLHEFLKIQILSITNDLSTMESPESRFVRDFKIHIFFIKIHIFFVLHQIRTSEDGDHHHH